MSAFMLVPYCFDYCSFIVQFDIRNMMLPTFFFLKISLAILGFIEILYNFRII